jgi:hypothetical protein
MQVKESPQPEPEQGATIFLLALLLVVAGLRREWRAALDLAIIV